MKVSKKTGKGAPAALKKGGAKVTPSVSRTTMMLYSFQRGVLQTCEIPSMKLDTHKQKFPKHRCGYFNGKFYFLEINPHCAYANDSDPLRELGTLKIYNPVLKEIEQKVSTCKCNCGEGVPLLVKGNEIIDLGGYPRVINASTGHRESIGSLSEVAEVGDCAACIVMNKTIYVAKSIDASDIENYMNSKYAEAEAEVPVQKTEIFAINCIGYQCTLLSSIEKSLSKISIVYVSPKELLVMGEEVGTVVYYMSGNTLVNEGYFPHKLGRCCSAGSIDGSLFMFFDSGKVVKREIKSGLMCVYDPLLFESLKVSLWACKRTGISRLPHTIIREIFINY